MPQTIIPSMPITRSASDGPRSSRNANSARGEAERDVGGGGHRSPRARMYASWSAIAASRAERPHGEVGEVQDLAPHVLDVGQVQHVDVQHDRVLAQLDRHRAGGEREQVGDQREQLVGAAGQRHADDRRCAMRDWRREDLAGRARRSSARVTTSMWPTRRATASGRNAWRSPVRAAQARARAARARRRRPARTARWPATPSPTAGPRSRPAPTT